MLTLTGTISNAYVMPAGVGKDGKPYSARHKLQLLHETHTRDGQLKQSLEDLTVSDSSIYAANIGKRVSIEVGVMVAGGGVLFYTISEGRIEA